MRRPQPLLLILASVTGLLSLLAAPSEDRREGELPWDPVATFSILGYDPKLAKSAAPCNRVSSASATVCSGLRPTVGVVPAWLAGPHIEFLYR